MPLGDKSHKCLNCGQEFVGNFCPRCSQSAETKSNVGWKTLANSVMDAFGLDTSPLLRTFWHLLWRPGHLISDYLNGKRQMCAPPLSTFIMAIMLYM